MIGTIAGCSKATANRRTDSLDTGIVNGAGMAGAAAGVVGGMILGGMLGGDEEDGGGDKEG